MAVQIRVVPDALREAADKQSGFANKMEELGQSIQSVISILDQAWDGTASRVLLESLQEVKKSSESTQECMKENAEKIRSVAQAFEAIDDNETGFTPIRAVEFQLLRCPRPSIIGNLVLKENSIRIIPEDVRAAAVRCSDVSQEYMDVRVMLQQSIEELKGNWEGNSYVKYSTECNEILSNLSEIDDVLSEISSKMRIAAMRYEEIDNSF